VILLSQRLFAPNLDQRPDRLEVMLSEWDGRGTIHSASRQSLNTGGLKRRDVVSHRSHFNTRTPEGWPYALAFEDDAARADGWDEVWRKRSLLTSCTHSTGDFTAAVWTFSISAHGVQAIVPHVLWAAPAGTLATTVAPPGSCSIAPAHAFLGELDMRQLFIWPPLTFSFNTYRGF